MKTKTLKSHPRKNLVTVEIGRDWLKVLEAQREGSGVAVSRLHVERVDENDPALAGAVASAFRDGHFSKTPVMLSIPRQMVTVRILKLPSTDPQEIADMVELQVDKQTPYSREEIISDYRILGGARGGYSRVMLAIVQRSVVRQRVNALEAAGIQIESVCVNSEGVLSWFSTVDLGSASGRAVVLVEVDSFYTEVSVSQNGVLLFSRSFRTGANQILQDKDGAYERFRGEVRRSLDVFRGENPGQEIEKILVSGAAAALDGLAEAMAGPLKLVCEAVDSAQSVRRMPKNPSLRDPLYSPVSVTGMVGIALAPDALEFNITPESVLLRKRLVARSHSLSRFGALLMTLTVSMSLYATLVLYFKHSELEYLQTMRESSDAVVQDVNRKVGIVKTVRNTQEKKFATVNVFSEVHRVRPEKVSVDQLEIDAERDKLTVSGTGTSLGEVRELVNALEGSRLFKNVKPGGTRLGRDGRYSFQVVADMEISK